MYALATSRPSHPPRLYHPIVTFLVTVDGVLDCQLDLLDTSAINYNRVSQFYNQQL
jgi:hypothetical protein